MAGGGAGGGDDNCQTPQLLLYVGSKNPGTEVETTWQIRLTRFVWCLTRFVGAGGGAQLWSALVCLLLLLLFVCLR